MKTLGVIGLGYVGLPLAVEAALKGYVVTGIDVNKGLLKLIDSRTSPYANDTRFEQAFAQVGPEQLVVTDDFAKLADVETVVICVPTPTEHNIPDLKLLLKEKQDELRRP